MPSPPGPHGGASRVKIWQWGVGSGEGDALGRQVGLGLLRNIEEGGNSPTGEAPRCGAGKAGRAASRLRRARGRGSGLGVGDEALESNGSELLQHWRILTVGFLVTLLSGGLRFTVGPFVGPI